jgi:uncharacterized protein YrzB (UPF0473 family)
MAFLIFFSIRNEEKKTKEYVLLRNESERKEKRMLYVDKYKYSKTLKESFSYQKIPIMLEFSVSFWVDYMNKVRI